MCQHIYVNWYKYSQNSRIGKISQALGAKKGDIIQFYNANEKKTGQSW